MNLSVALVFAPSHYLVDPKYSGSDILTRLFRTRRVIDGSTPTEQICGVTVELWREWAMRFQPDCSVDLGTIPEATTLKDDNPFADLAEEETPA